MKKNGFTLVELLVVVAIIAILSVIIIPSVINVNKNVNKRLLDSKKQNITSAATLYASRNDDIFNGVDEVQIFVSELIDMGYLEIDVVSNDDIRCNTTDKTRGAKGCIINPVNSETLNNDYVILRKQGAAGYYVEYFEFTYDYDGTNTTTDKTLVTAVCNAYASGSLIGQTKQASATKRCECIDKNTSDSIPYDTLVIKGTSSEVNACIVSGENPNNYLKYGDSKPNWRVLGVYNIDGSLTAKMITSEPI